MARSTYAIASLRRQLKPFRLHWYSTLGSTNTKAAELRRERKLLAPAIVLTGRQTAGRGRGGNRWLSPPGVLTATFVLPTHDRIPPHLVPLVAGVAVLRAVRELGAEGVGLKWPNDLWAEGDLKLAGLLCERVQGIDLIGVGLNWHLDPRGLPGILRKSSTSLHLLTATPPTADDVLRAVARQLALALTSDELQVTPVLQEFARRHVLDGRRVQVTQDSVMLTGRVAGIDRHGRLLLEGDDGQMHRLVGGTVRPSNHGVDS